MSKRPGVMLYLEIRPCLAQLNYEEKGRLFEAILSYADDGVLPEFNDRLEIAWSFIRLRIDADNEKYQAKCERAREAREAREAKVRAELFSANPF